VRSVRLGAAAAAASPPSLPPPPPPCPLPRARAQPEPAEFLAKLTAAFESTSRPGRPDLAAFGRAFGRLIFDAPGWVPLLGPLSIEPRAKKQSAAAAAKSALLAEGGGAAAAPAARPARDTHARQELSSEAVVQQQEAQNAARTNALYDLLVKLHEHPRADELVIGEARLEDVPGVVRRPLIRLIPTLFDAWSYTQTVSERAQRVRSAAASARESRALTNTPPTSCRPRARAGRESLLL
jgi:hypothetical protein